MKIDLHIHTVQNKFLDRSFVFSNDLFKEYITENSLEIVAITNHNLFDLTNFRNIKSLLNGVNCLVLPGIEISLEKGHMLVIFDDTEENLKTLKNISDSISLIEKDDHYSMDVTTFNNLCCGKAAMLIPHYEKSPSVSKTILDLRSDDV